MPVATKSACFSAGPSAFTRLRQSISSIAFLSASVAAPAMAADFSVSTELQLRDAIIAANASPDASSTITVTSNIIITDPASLPASTKALTISAGPGINGVNAITTTGSGGNALILSGPNITLAGNITAGSAATASSNAAGGVAVIVNGGAATNSGTITGGEGGRRTFSNGAPYGTGIGGDAVQINAASTFTNSGTIVGGRGGIYNAELEPHNTVNSNLGFGAIGVRGTAGSNLVNNGSITGGTGGSTINFTTLGDNLFAGVGGTGATLIGGNHINNGQISGGMGGLGANFGSGSGHGAGGVGISLTGGAVMENSAAGTIRAANGIAGGGGPVGGGSHGGNAAVLDNATLINLGSVTGGNTARTAGSFEGVGFGV